MSNYAWQDEIKKWCGNRASSDLVDAFVDFFRLAFTSAPEGSWFGYHRSRISLVVGNLWLAAIALSPKRADLLVDENFTNDGLYFVSAPSTENYTPLGWVIAEPWDNISTIINSQEIWTSYARACMKIFDSPVSIPRTDKHYRRLGKAKLTEIPGMVFSTQHNAFRSKYVEGGIREVTTELLKRNPVLRAKAIAKYGNTCQVCGFNFGDFYGGLGAGYIEVHHLRPLSRRRTKQATTIKDLAIVCANCHRILHRNGKVPITLDELRKAIRSAR
jgi:hypothetical protein